jgi:hypothetical protein
MTDLDVHELNFGDTPIGEIAVRLPGATAVRQSDRSHPYRKQYPISAFRRMTCRQKIAAACKKK